ncbi:MAG TPA: aldo/keto reductase [Thermoanaerobaculia bacterium]|jgi:aryl-alcohol dehydrogenase-like predicted oxidoreductase|nr:aldo/keto reductase [Thermoanaerobaculia bacterium]
MQLRELGSTGIKVSEIGFGAWAIGGPAEASGVPFGWGRTNDDDSLAAIRRARDLGVTFFDTADSYGFGRSESLLGIVLSRKRQDMVIATKVGVVRGMGGGLQKDFSKEHIFHACDASLRRLRTDYIDVYQLHNPTLDDLRREDAQEAMDRLQELGKIRYWGVSITTPEEGVEIVRRGWGYTLQVLYNLLNQAPEKELFPLAKEKGYGIIARVPLASGLLTGKFRQDTVFAQDDIRQNFLTPKRLEEAIARVDEAKAIIGGATRSLAEGALRFVLSHDAVSTVIPGAKNARQVELNAAAVEARLPADVVEKLRARLGDYNLYQRHGIRI